MEEEEKANTTSSIASEFLIQHLQYECSEELKNDLLNLKAKQREDKKIKHIIQDLEQSK